MRNATHGLWYLNPICPVSAAVWGVDGALFEKVGAGLGVASLASLPVHSLCFLLVAEDKASQLPASGPAAIPPLHYGLSP